MAPSAIKKRKQEEECEENNKVSNKKARRNEPAQSLKSCRNVKGKSSILLNDKLKISADKKNNSFENKGAAKGKKNGGQDGKPRLRRMASLNAQAKMHALYDSDGRSNIEELVTALEAASATKMKLKKLSPVVKGKKAGGKASSNAATSPRRMASLNAQAILAASYSTERPKLSPKAGSNGTPTPNQGQGRAKKKLMISEEEGDGRLKRKSIASDNETGKRERKVSVDKGRTQVLRTSARCLDEQIDLEKTLDLAKMVISGENDVLLRDKIKSENVRRDKIEDKAEVTITGMYINPVTNTSQSFCFSRVQTYKQATSTTFTPPNIPGPRPPPAHHPPVPPPPPSAYCHFGHYPPSSPSNVAPSNLTANAAGSSLPLDLALARHYNSAFAVPHYTSSHNSTHYTRHPTGYYQPADSCLIHKPVPFHPFPSNQSSRLPQPPLANTPGSSSSRNSFSTSHLASYQRKSPAPESHQQQRNVQQSSLPAPPSQDIISRRGSKQNAYCGSRVSQRDNHGDPSCQWCVHLASTASTSSGSLCPIHWKNTRTVRGRPSILSVFSRPQPTKPDVGGRLSTLPTQTKTDVRTVSLIPNKRVKMEVDELISELEPIPTLNKRYAGISPIGNHPMATRRLKGSPEELNKSAKHNMNKSKIDSAALQMKRNGKDGAISTSAEEIIRKHALRDGVITVSAEEFFKKVTSSANWMTSVQHQKEMEALRRAFNPTVTVPCLPLASQLKKLAANQSRIVSNRAKIVGGAFREGNHEIVNGSKRMYQNLIIHSSKSLGIQQQQRPSTSTTNVSRKSLPAENANNGNVEVVSAIPRNRAIKNVTRYSNGWTWEGPAFQKDIYIKNDDPPVRRRCFPAMRHIEGDIIRIRDCVLLKSGPRKNDLPYVAKVAALWENPEDGEMMFSLLWYYRPEHTEFGRKPHHMEDEIFASKHRDVNSVACIEDKCFVLTMNEYCRYRRRGRMIEQCVISAPSVVAAISSGYQRKDRQPPGRVSSDMVFFCRKVYDFRQKRILKNPT